jgi:hypothetical protein
MQVVFISNLLMSAGVRVWLDETCLNDHIKTSVLQGLDSSRFVVAFLSPEYIEKIAAADSVRAAFIQCKLCDCCVFLALWHVRGLLQAGCGTNLAERRIHSPHNESMEYVLLITITHPRELQAAIRPPQNVHRISPYLACSICYYYYLCDVSQVPFVDYHPCHLESFVAK